MESPRVFGTIPRSEKLTQIEYTRLNNKRIALVIALDHVVVENTLPLSLVQFTSKEGLAEKGRRIMIVMAGFIG